MDEISLIISEVRAELERALTKHPVGSNNAHGGYAVLLEEVDELWNDIKSDNLPAARKEAIQVAAMAIRMIKENLSG